MKSIDQNIRYSITTIDKKDLIGDDVIRKILYIFLLIILVLYLIIISIKLETTVEHYEAIHSPYMNKRNYIEARDFNGSFVSGKVCEGIFNCSRTICLQQNNTKVFTITVDNFPGESANCDVCDNAGIPGYVKLALIMYIALAGLLAMIIILSFFIQNTFLGLTVLCLQSIQRIFTISIVFTAIFYGKNDNTFNLPPCSYYPKFSDYAIIISGSIEFALSSYLLFKYGIDKSSLTQYNLVSEVNK